MTADLLLQVSSLSVRQKGAHLLREISLTLGAGKCLAVVGPNGAGKTTLLRAVAGLIPPSSGSVRLLGNEAASLKPERRARVVGLVPQRLAHVPPFTVREFLELSGLERGEGSLSLVRHLERRLLTEISGGELQRVLIAGAVAQGAALLLLDEPTASLDPVGRKEVEGVLRACRESMGLSYIMVTHDVALAARAADSITIMRDGALVWTGNPQDSRLVSQLSDAYGCEFVQLAGDTRGPGLVVPV